LGFGLVAATGGIGFKNHFNLVANLAEDGEFFLVRAGGMGGIVKSPMMAV
jgi:hypothetical protein